MLYKLKQTFFIILSLIILNACQTRWVADTFVKSRQNKEQLKRDKEKQKKKKEYRQSAQKKREKQYNKQAASTKETWDWNSKQSKSWRKNKFHKKPFGYRIRKFFEKFKREPKPSDGGLYSKKQMRKSKGNLFQKIFKKNKKKK